MLTLDSVCVTSVLRMTTLDTSSKSLDQTWGNLNSTIWTTIEANTGIICACLPMLKTPLAALFPKLFPRGSYREYSEGSGTPHHLQRPSLPRHSPASAASAYDGWGRLIDKKPSAATTRMSGNTMIGSIPPGKCSRNNSSNGDFAMNGDDIPLGQIAKTTHVNVQYANDSCFPGSSPNDNQHSRSVSNLVSPGFNCTRPL